MLATILAVGMLFAQSAPAAAAAPGNVVSPVTVNPKAANLDKKPDPNRLVCHEESVVGTLFPRKVCATVAEIADRRNHDQAQTRAAQAQRPYVIDSGKLPGT